MPGPCDSLYSQIGTAPLLSRPAGLSPFSQHSAPLARKSSLALTVKGPCPPSSCRDTCSLVSPAPAHRASRLQLLTHVGKITVSLSQGRQRKTLPPTKKKKEKERHHPQLTQQAEKTKYGAGENFKIYNYLREKAENFKQTTIRTGVCA